MNRKIKIWGRDFDLKVFFDVYEGEEILNVQEEALDSFVNAADKLFASYEELEDYCIHKDGNLIGDSIENIFKYVKPESVYVKRSNMHTVALLCNYRFDEEHGIALIYENEKLKYIGTQDDI